MWLRQGFVAVQAAAVLGCLVQCSRARSAVWAAGGGSVLLPALLEACPLALSGGVPPPPPPTPCHLYQIFQLFPWDAWRLFLFGNTRVVGGCPPR